MSNSISANFEDALIQSLKGIDNLQLGYIAEFAAKLAPVYGVNETDMSAIIRRVESRLVSTMR